MTIQRQLPETQRFVSVLIPPLKYFDQWKQIKLQWLQNPSQMNGDNLNNVRPGTSRTIRNREDNIECQD
jgi:hypothetical protein